jgi:hypothetical protein
MKPSSRREHTLIYFTATVVFAALLAGIALAPSTASAVPIYARISCADWTAVQRADPEGDGKNFHYLALGTVNGAASASGVDLWGSPALVEPQDLYSWIDGYCASFPEVLMQAAIGAWVNERTK